MYPSETIEQTEISEILEKKILFPFIFAIYFVLSVYEHNIGQVSFTDALLPLGIILAGTYTAYYILNYLIDNKKKAGLITFIFMIAGFSWGVQTNLFVARKTFELIGINIARRRYLILLNIILASVLSFEVYRRDFEIGNAIKIANIVTSFLLIMVLFNILIFQIPHTGSSGLDNSLSIDNSSIEDPPNIYYIILDRYGRNDILQNQYGFNNSNFTNSLKDQGFYFANESYSNIPKTYLHLATSLNLQYPQQMGLEESHRQKEVYPIINDNIVQDYLKTKKYRIYHTGIEKGNYNQFADKSIQNKYRSFLGTFESNLITNTPLGALPINLVERQKSYYVQENVEQLEKFSKTDGRKFVITHLRMPHPPFDFGPDGNPINYRENVSRSKKYINELQATNKLLNETVEEILSNENKNNTIIIIQGDEGPFTQNRVGSDNYNWIEASDRQKRKRSGVINAIYAPGMNESKFYRRMTPVNTFRIVFNEYFGSNLSLQEDKVYLKERKKLHDLLEVEPNVLYPNTSLTTTQQYSEAVPRASTDATPQT